jgi:peptide/nickel transport system substrate-binding protein
VRRKLIVSIFATIAVVALLLSSCGKTPSTTTATTTATTTTGAVMIKNAAGKMVEKPQYGGVFTHYIEKDTRITFDDGVNPYFWCCYSQFFVNEKLYNADRTKSAMGTGQNTNVLYALNDWRFFAPNLAESYSMPDDETIIFKIRQGVHFTNKDPVNGREMDANDVAYSFNRTFTLPTTWNYQAYTAEEKPLSIKATDKWTVEIKVPKGNIAAQYRLLETFSFTTRIVPHEMVEKYNDLTDWKNSCGTGPFTLENWVKGSVMTLKKNPNYWKHDPLMPDFQLPYIDEINWIVIPDASTRLAAVQTAKIEQLPKLELQDAKTLWKSNPDLQYFKFVPAQSLCYAGRIDVKPFDDVRVRRALEMAINRQEIIDTLFSGEAIMLNVPVMATPEFSNMYIPLDKLPAAVQELFKYQPDKAKQLLAEAGYPNGFTTTVDCSQTDVEWLSIVKEYWTKIGVTLNINPMEAGAVEAERSTSSHKQMVTSWLVYDDPFGMTPFIASSSANIARINDPLIQEAYEKINAAGFDRAKKEQIYKEIAPYILEQAYYFDLPRSYNYVFWWPWIKNYNGEDSTGFYDRFTFPIYIWIDQALKTKMGH